MSIWGKRSTIYIVHIGTNQTKGVENHCDPINQMIFKVNKVGVVEILGHLLGRFGHAKEKCNDKGIEEAFVDELGRGEIAGIGAKDESNNNRCKLCEAVVLGHLDYLPFSVLAFLDDFKDL